ncbi:MAG: ATP-dependent DNA helicase [Acidimicrobiales bacterium]
MTLADDTAITLEAVTAALPGGGEQRLGQAEMARAVADTITGGEHLVVQAGTGTGKSLAYLVPAVLSGQKVVVATATKALQDQLAQKDLPFLAAELDADFRFAVLKGRSNYVCLQRVHELESDNQQLALDGVTNDADQEQLDRILEWVDDTADGDRAGLDFEPSPAAWAAVSVGPRECPGRSRCPRGEECFAEEARDRASQANVVVVNTHLYGLHVATDNVLAEHDLVVIDEAHQLEDIASASLGFELSPHRFRHLARTVRAILEDDDLVSALDEAGDRLADDLGRRSGTRLPDERPAELLDVLDWGRQRVDRIANALRNIPDDVGPDVAARKIRAVQATTGLIDEIDQLSDTRTDSVAWVEGTTLRVAPIDIAGALSERLWSARPAVLTSATLPAALPQQLGLTDHKHHVLDVGSPFDYESNALLYCAAHLPDPRDAERDEALHAELESLIVAAGGRTLALFTSRRAMLEAADELTPRLQWRVLTQDELPKQKLIEVFTAEPETSLFATMSFWQGVDVPGPTLSLVTIDRLPFPRPDDPLLDARRDRAGRQAFQLIDVPRAATLLAHGAGRLIRSATDTGVVAVLDPRLATKKSYRWAFIEALPNMRRTRDKDEVVRVLNTIRDQ